MQSRGKRCVISLPRNALAQGRNTHLSQFEGFLRRQTLWCRVLPRLLFATLITSTPTRLVALSRRLRAHVVVARAGQ